MAVVSNFVEAENKEFISLIKELSHLELEIHSRGELSVEEVFSLLKRFYLFVYKNNIHPKNLSGNYFSDSLNTRLASLLSLWASCEGIKLTLSEMSEFILLKEFISFIFYCSGYRGVSHLKTYLAEKQADGKFIIPQDKLILYFIMVHIDDLDHEYFTLAEQMPIEIFVVLMLGWLNSQIVLSERGEDIRKRLYAKSDVLKRVVPNISFMACVLNAWMYCSYSPSANKMEIKKNINAMIENFHQKSRFTGLKKTFNKKNINCGKPRMLVIHERVGSKHAMFRCYLPYFKSLHQNFDVISLAESDLDESSKSVFPNHIVIADVNDFKWIVDKILEVSPDIIYYPSLGMSHYTIYLANLRLAPMQIMTTGHPESSFSKSMDFIFSGVNLKGIEGKISENAMVVDDFVSFDALHPDFSNDVKYTPKYADGRKHVAINCSAMKLSSEFIKCLKALQSKCAGKIQYHFYPSGQGFLSGLFEVAIKRQFPDACVYQPAPYLEFLKSLAKCHFSLAPFPFGNYNSTVDALLLSMPVVALKGDEICSYTDYVAMKTYGLSDRFVHDSVDSYLLQAERFIFDSSYFNEAVQEFEDIGMINEIKKKDVEHPYFSHFIYSVYKKLNRYKSQKKRVILWKDGQIVDNDESA